MPNWKKVIVSGSDATLNSLNVTTALTASGLNYPTVDGTANQVIQTDGLGNLSFGSVDTTYEVVKNVAGTTLYKGTPVHATASNASGNIVGIIAASASNPATMPATFILNEDLADQAEGYAIISGLIQGVDTSAFEEGDVVYVGENSGYTNVKPTGSNLIQNLGIVTKIHPSNGAGIVLGAGRSNDVPNLLSGEVFWGENNRSIQKPLAHILSGSSYTYSGSFSGSFQGDGSGLTGITISGSVEWVDVLNKPSGIVSSSAQLSDTTIPGNLTIGGTITAQEFHTEFVSASIIYQSGSTKFGDTSDDIHQFTGSIQQSGSNSYFLGNVGVGTASPSSILHVRGFGTTSSTTAFRVENSNASASFQVFDDNHTEFENDIIINQNPAGYSSLILNSDSPNKFWKFRNQASSGILSIQDGGFNNLVQIRNQNIGNLTRFTTDVIIGKSNAQYGSNTLYISGSESKPLIFAESAQSQFTVKGSGNVGINNTDPQYRLDVSGSGRFTDGLTVTGSIFHNGDLTVTGKVTAQEFHTEFVSASIIYQSGSTKFGDTSDDIHQFTGSIQQSGSNSYFLGNVGIGTTSPSHKLDVNGTFRAGSNLGSNSVTIGTTGATTINTTGGNTGLTVNDTSNGVFALKGGSQTYRLLTLGSSQRFEIRDFTNADATRLIITSTGNVGIGTTSPTSKLDVSGSVSIDGKIALNDGGNSVYIGDDAGLNDDKSDNQNVGVGHQALYSNTTGNSNIANGYRALFSNTTGCQNVANGTQALYSNTTGYRNTVNGYQALLYNTTGNNNTANGSQALYSNTIGYNNIATGYQALLSNTTGNENTANGVFALYYNTTGNNNVANGYYALYSNTTGYRNTANGERALYSNTTGIRNTANGYYALPFLATGSNNIGEGYQAGSYQVGTTDPLTEVNNSVFIGYNTKGTLSATNENVFGYAAEGNGSNSVTIGNTSVTKTIINGNLGLGTTSPSARLEIQSSTVPTLMLRKEGNTGYALISGSSDLGFEFKTYDNGVVDAMKITKDGKVGIGTTSPSHKLDVAGNVLVTTSGSTQPLKTFEATYKQFSVDYPNSPSIYTTELNFGLYGRIQYNGNGGILSIVNRSTQAGSSSMRFVMGTTERMRITDTGNVGIGTTSPSSKLHVSGSGGGSDVLLVEPAGAPTISLKSSSTLTDYSGLHVGNKYLLITKNSGAIFQNIQGGLRFANGFAAKSVITENGYFGIGFNTTTGIDYPLDVKGDARISGSGNFTDGLTVTGSLVVQNPTVSNRYLKLGWGSIIGNDTQSEVSIYSHGGSLTASTIFVNGNNKPTNPAGISLRANGGVAIYGGNHLSEFTPSARLHVSGSGIFTDGLTVTGSINQTGDLTVDGIITAREFHTEFVSSSIIYESGSTKFGDTSDDVHHFTGSIQQSGSNSYFLGNVGIGTTSPQQLLDITATTTAPVLRLSRNENINSTLWAGESLGDIEFYTNDPSNPNVFGKISVVGGSGSGTPHSGYPDGHMVFFTAGQQGGSLSEKMRITDEGNVGIGTTSPSHKLDIAGDVRILSSSLSYQENIDVDSAATEVVATVSISDYDAAFFDYVIKSGTNLRAGTVTAVHNGTSVEYNEVSTQDLGTTSGVTLSVDISGTDLRLLATTTTDNWTVKSLIRTL